MSGPLAAAVGTTLTPIQADTHAETKGASNTQ